MWKTWEAMRLRRGTLSESSKRMSHLKGGETPIYIFHSQDNRESDCVCSLVPTEPNNMKDKLLKNQGCQTQEVSTKMKV